jgi:hypothetical protein
MQCTPAGVHGFFACSVRDDTRQARWSLARRASCSRVLSCRRARVVVIVGVGSSARSAGRHLPPLGVEPRRLLLDRRRVRRRGGMDAYVRETDSEGCRERTGKGARASTAAATFCHHNVFFFEKRLQEHYCAVIAMFLTGKMIEFGT